MRKFSALVVALSLTMGTAHAQTPAGGTPPPPAPGTPVPAPAVSPTAPPPPTSPAPYIGPNQMVTRPTEVVLTSSLVLSARTTLVQFTANVGLPVTAIRGGAPISVSLPANTPVTFIVVERGTTLPAGTYKIGNGSSLPYDFPLPPVPVLFDVDGVPSTTVDAPGALIDSQKRAAKNAAAAAASQAAADAASTTATTAVDTATAAKTAAAAAQTTANLALDLAKENGTAIKNLTTSVENLAKDLGSIERFKTGPDGRIYSWMKGVDGISRWYARDQVTGCYFVLP